MGWARCEKVIGSGCIKLTTASASLKACGPAVKERHCGFKTLVNMQRPGRVIEGMSFEAIA
jgi:hypothetical protein